MKSVHVNKAELLARIEANRREHRGLFLKALVGWQKEAIRVLNEAYEKALINKLDNVQVYLPRPDDHTDEYDRAIEMLKMETSDIVEITADDFAHFVQDDWDWKDRFLATSSVYAAMA